MEFKIQLSNIVNFTINKAIQIFGIIIIVFSIIFMLSLISYSPNDPGFNQLNYNINDNKISNLFGFFGAYLSSYSLIFIGTLSYLLALFIIIEGGKLFLGVSNRFIIFPHSIDIDFSL